MIVLPESHSESAGKIMMALGFAVTFVFFALRYRVIKHLEEKFPDDWKAMGSPVKLFGDNNTTGSEERLISSRIYLTWGDPEFSKRCTHLYWFRIFFAAVFMPAWIIVWCHFAIPRYSSICTGITLLILVVVGIRALSKQRKEGPR